MQNLYGNIIWSAVIVEIYFMKNAMTAESQLENLKGIVLEDCLPFRTDFNSCYSDLTKALNQVISDLNSNELLRGYRRSQKIVRWASVCEERAERFDVCCVNLVEWKERERERDRDTHGPDADSVICELNMEQIDKDVKNLTERIDRALERAVNRLYSLT